MSMCGSCLTSVSYAFLNTHYTQGLNCCSYIPMLQNGALLFLTLVNIRFCEPLSAGNCLHFYSFGALLSAIYVGILHWGVTVHSFRSYCVVVLRHITVQVVCLQQVTY